jgi:alpha-tubulin suppressor-like RCC1 family protein
MRYRLLIFTASALLIGTACAALTAGNGFPSISSGDGFTCFLAVEGGVKCWGDDHLGALGNGMTQTSSLPVKVSGLSTGVIAISAGGEHACALLKNGGVKCWGYNEYGQLGDGTVESSRHPVDVRRMAIGLITTYVPRTPRPGVTEIRSLPGPVSGLESGVAAISAGGSFTCALMESGGVKCWGENVSGELGDGTNESKDLPTDVRSLEGGVAAVSAGQSHACALMKNGGVKCWGFNGYGQLGDGTDTSSNLPVDVTGLAKGVIAISAGGGHTCAVLKSGGVKCWGFNNSGELGDGTSIYRYLPTAVSGLTSGVTAVSSGGDHTCVLMNGGGVKCWGNGDLGQLGNGRVMIAKLPVDVSGLVSGVAAVSAGGDHTCAVIKNGGVKCWGDDNYGALGDGTLELGKGTIRKTPVDVIGLTG